MLSVTQNPNGKRMFSAPTKSLVIFRITEKIHKNLPEKILSLEENPNLDMGGKENIKITPALELVKAVCKVATLCA